MRRIWVELCWIVDDCAEEKGGAGAAIGRKVGGLMSQLEVKVEGVR